MPIAQTNVQLYNQLLAAGWIDDDLRQVRSAYQLAMQLVAGQFCPNEKPLLAHLVGVASILADDGAPPTVVCAGLLHAVYRRGEFGDGSRGPTEAKRREVRRNVGAACEELIVRYAGCVWNVETLEHLAARGLQLPVADTAMALVKIASLLENQTDAGHGYLFVDQGATEDRGRQLALAVELAEALDRPTLAEQLRQACAASDAEIPYALQANDRHCLTMAPMSHRERATVRINRLCRKLRAQLTAKAPVLTRRAA